MPLKVKTYVLNYWPACLLILVTMGLFFMPTLLWGNLYSVGGDDARLYYLFPQQYLHNYSFNLIGNNVLGGNFGYLAESYSVPIIYLVLFLKSLFPLIHAQFFLYGIILSLGFLSFFFLTGEVISKKGSVYFFSRLVSALFYIFSNYITQTFFQHQQLSIFLVMVFPFCLYLFIAGIKRKNIVWIIACSFVYSMFSSTVLSLPWFLPALFTTLPFLFFFLWEYRSYSWKAILTFAVVTCFTNFYWIIHYIIPLIYRTADASVVGNLTSGSFIKENHNLIESLSQLNSPLSQILNYLRTGWGQRQGVRFMELLGIAYLLVICVAGMVLIKVNKKLRTLYVVSLFGLLLTMAFITPNFGQWNVNLFEFFNDHVPLFGMFRTMYDKFSLGMAFNSALVLFISLVVLAQAKGQKLYQYMALVLVTAVILVTAMPFVRHVYQDEGYSARISGQMNSDFFDLTTYIKNIDTTSRFLWFPMTFPGYVYIGDARNPNHFYAGLSPVLLFSGKNDMAGFYGLSTPFEPGLNWRILELMRQNAYEDVATILGLQNIGYVILNHEKLSGPGQAAMEGFDFISLQSSSYQELILGEKVKDFGSRYSLYRFNKKFSVPTIFLTREVSKEAIVDKQVSFRRMPNGDYDVIIEGLSESMKLVFQEPYSRFWKVRVMRGDPILSSGPTIAYGYGNTWTIAPLRGQVSEIHLQIYFWPNMLVTPSIILSIVAVVIAGLYCVVRILRKR